MATYDSSFPGAPRLLKGALVGRDPRNPRASVVVFQYNPDTLSRTVRAQTIGGTTNIGQTEALRLTGPPQETIQLEMEIDAADQLAQAAFPATTFGIYPTLSSLEMLLYPQSSVAFANELLADAGVIEIVPPEAPLCLFVWGARRVVPVRVTEFTINEEAFDPNLNPIRAKVAMTLTVLTYQDLGLSSAGGAMFMVHQVAKEAMAAIYSLGMSAASFTAATSVTIQGG